MPGYGTTSTDTLTLDPLMWRSHTPAAAHQSMMTSRNEHDEVRYRVNVHWIHTRPFPVVIRRHHNEVSP